MSLVACPTSTTSPGIKTSNSCLSYLKLQLVPLVLRYTSFCPLSYVTPYEKRWLHLQVAACW